MSTIHPHKIRCCRAWPLSILLALSLSSSPTAARADETRPIWLGISGIASVHHNRLDSLNGALASTGYSTIGTNQPIFGLGVDGGIGRLRFAWDSGMIGARSYQRRSDGARFDVNQASISLDVGYEILKIDGLSIFPMVGAAGGDIRLQIDPAASPVLPDQVSLYGNQLEIRRNTWSLRGLLGVEQRIALWTRADDRLLLVAGLRLGYVQQVAENRWMFEDSAIANLQGGPTVDNSGPFWRFGIGVAGSTR